MFVTFAILFCFKIVINAVAADKYISGSNTDKAAALQFLQDHNEQNKVICNKNSVAVWNYMTNITEETKRISLEVEKEAAEFDKVAWRNATSFAWKDFRDDNPLAYRWFKSLSVLGDAALPDDKFDKLQELISNMTDLYSTAKVCNGSLSCDNPTLDLEPDLGNIMAHSSNYEELQRVWLGWRDATGKKLREPFMEYVDLKNEAARLNGFSDAGDAWREPYESDTFQEDLEKLWNDMKPFYTQLHAYTRKKLIEMYPGKIKPDGPIPAHIVGNMWAGTWAPLFKPLQPYPNEQAINVTRTMNEKKMTPVQLFELAEEFFTSLGLPSMTSEFWNKSLIVKPSDRQILCHPAAFDFCDGKDVRIKMCTQITMDDLITIHHEMGHIEYYLLYAPQPLKFHDGANPGFHEAIGDTIALSVSTPTHLKEIGLLDEVKDNAEADINFLMQMALDKVPFLPFGYLLDLWRWNVFSGNITRQELNTKWWEMKLKYQGVCPPVQRTEEDLDAATLLHVIADISYMRYFVSFVIQFQFHRALCKEAGYTGPLHKCDIYRNTAAGKLLSDILKKGSSIPWTEAMSIITKGETNKMDASGILEYFDPLIKWLDTQNNGETIGWTSADPTICP